MNTRSKIRANDKYQVKLGFAGYLLIVGGILIVIMFLYTAVQLHNLPGF